MYPNRTRTPYLLRGFAPSLALMLLCQAASAGLPKYYQLWEVPNLGAPGMLAIAISNNGQITGSGNSPGTSTGDTDVFRWPTVFHSFPRDIAPPGVAPSWGHSINDNGDIAGVATVNGVEHPVIYGINLGGMTDLGTLGSTVGGWGVASGINDAGQVAGASSLPSGVPHAFLWSNGTMQDLGSLGGASFGSWGSAINSSGDVTGDSWLSSSSSGPAHAVIFPAGTGTVIDIGTLGGTDSSGYAINDAGHVAGQSNDSQSRRWGFLYANGMMTNLGALPGHQTSWAFGINNLDQVVGESGPEGPDARAFIYSDGKLVNLNAMISSTDPLRRWVILHTAYGINDSGWIVASGSDKRDTNAHAYVLEPVF